MRAWASHGMGGSGTVLQLFTDENDAIKHMEDIAYALPAPLLPPPGLMPRPLLHREAVRQLSFRCPVSVASELKRKAAFNQLEQQEIIIEGLKRVLAELPTPPEGWQEQ